MKNLIVSLLLILCSTAYALTSGNWNFGKVEHDELRRTSKVMAINIPLSSLDQDSGEDYVTLAVLADTGEGYSVFLKSQELAFACAYYCEVTYRFDDGEVEAVDFLRIPSALNLITLPDSEVGKFVKNITTSDVLIIEVVRQPYTKQQFKYQLQGFMPQNNK